MVPSKSMLFMMFVAAATANSGSYSSSSSYSSYSSYSATTSAPTPAPTTSAPTPAPTNATTSAPTGAPTLAAGTTGAPTVSPTPAPTKRQRPTFDADAFKLTSFKVVASIASVTLAPTTAPTPSPTFAGFIVEEVSKEVQTVSSEVSFPLSEAEAKNPVMQLALTTGVAVSLGLDPEATVKIGDKTVRLVEIAKIGGKAVRRRLQSSTAIDFSIVAPDATDDAGGASLAADLKAAASEGSMVANIQKAASDAGVLVAALRNMPRKQTVTTKIVKQTVKVQEAKLAPVTTPSPTASPTKLVLSSATISAVHSMVLVVCICISSALLL